MTAATPNFASLLRPFIPLDFVNPFIIRTEHPAKVRFLDSGGVHRTPETGDANPERALVPSAVEGSRAEGARLPVKPFTIRTSEKSARNPFTIRTSKTQDLKPFRIRTYKKKIFFRLLRLTRFPVGSLSRPSKRGHDLSCPTRRPDRLRRRPLQKREAEQRAWCVPLPVIYSALSGETTSKGEQNGKSGRRTR
jgi:hypothetical protein